MHCGEPQVNLEVKSKWFLVRHGESKFNKEKLSQGQMEGNPSPKMELLKRGKLRSG